MFPWWLIFIWGSIAGIVLTFFFGVMSGGTWPDPNVEADE